MIEPSTTLSSIRYEIDRVDDAILALLARRFALAPEVRKLKNGKRLFRPEREAALLARVSHGPVPSSVARAVWTQIIAGMLQAEGVGEVVISEERLRLPAVMRFGQVLPVRVDPEAQYAEALDRILIVSADTALPPGCTRLAEVRDSEQVVVGHVIEREEMNT